MDVFKELIPNLLTKNRDLVDLNSDTFEREFERNSFILNRFFSQFIELVPFGAEVNAINHVDARLRYDYLFYAIPKQKVPFSKWAKGEKTDINKLISKAYSVSYQRAEEMARLLSEDDIKQLQEFYDVGGKRG